MSEYGTGQRLAFAMMCIGFILCAIGGCSPYWMTSEMDLADASFGLTGNIPILGDLLGDFSIVDINLGVWVFCIEYLGSGNSHCYTFYGPREDTDLNVVSEEEDTFAWIQLVRFAVAINVSLSVICGFVACCRCLCASGGKTICHGVFAFLAGGCGVFAFAVMLSRKEELVPGIFFSEITLEWSSYLYAAGSCLMVLASFLLCFSEPNESPNGVVMPMPMVVGVPAVQQQGVVTVPINQYPGQVAPFVPPHQSTAFQQPMYSPMTPNNQYPGQVPSPLPPQKVGPNDQYPGKTPSPLPPLEQNTASPQPLYPSTEKY